MTRSLKLTLRRMMLATAASAMMLAAAAATAPASAQDYDADGMSDMRAPSANPDMGVGSEYRYNENGTNDSGMEAPKKKKSGGLFSKLFGSDEEDEASIANAPRRVPALNQQIQQGNSYQNAVPVTEVQSGPAANEGWQPAPIQMANPEQGLPPLPADGASSVDSSGYPDLSSVPQRPAAKPIVRQQINNMDDLQAARSSAQQKSNSLNDAVKAEMSGDAVSPQSASQANASQTNADTSQVKPVGKTGLVSIEEPAPAMYSPEMPPVAQSQGEVVEEVPMATQVPYNNAHAIAPQIAAAPAQPASAPIIMGAPPAPLVAPEGSVPVYTETAPQAIADTNIASANDAPIQLHPPVPMDAAPVYPAPQASQASSGWVDMSQAQNAGQSQPMQEVAVGMVPSTASVSPIPVVSEGTGGIDLNPPSGSSANARTLPESRYAARRQAVYMQQYTHQSQTNN